MLLLLYAGDGDDGLMMLVWCLVKWSMCLDPAYKSLDKTQAAGEGDSEQSRSEQSKAPLTSHRRQVESKFRITTKTQTPTGRKLRSAWVLARCQWWGGSLGRTCQCGIIPKNNGDQTTSKPLLHSISATL